MKNKLSIVIILLVLITASCQEENKTEVRFIAATKWQYKGIDKQWRKAYTPESIFSSLRRDTLLQDPFYNAQFLKQSWIDTISWEYRSIIKINQEPSKQKYELNANGIVGKANVYFNDSLIFQIDDNFKNYQKDVSSLVHKGNNSIKIKFFSIKDLKKYYSKINKIPLPFNGLEMFRVPFFYFDNTCGITLFPVGIKKNPGLINWNKAIIRDINFKILDIQKDKYALIKAEYDIEASKKTELRLQLINKSKYYIDKNIKLEPGINHFSFNFKVKKPKLWWTHDLGKANLYDFYTKISIDKKTIQNIKKTIGIRQITIDTTDHDFVLYLNGTPLTLKIINYTTPELLYENLNKNSYNSYVRDLVLANINMVHITQTGLYEDNKFYEQCDKQGVLVWQDFMLPYKIMPNNNHLFENIRQESIYQIKRLRQHPSIAFWSGQNFLKKYEKQYNIKLNKSDSLSVLKFNKDIFNKLLPELVTRYDSGSYYFDKMNFNSIVNITDKYIEFPHIEALRRFTMFKDRHIGSKLLKKYEQNKNADSILTNALIETYGSYPEDIAGYMYLVSMFKENYFEQKILKQRFNTRFNGYIVGNYRDNTPFISQSAVDYKGHWKGKMYAIKKAFNPLLIKINEDNGWVYIDVKSDFNKDISADFYFKLSDLKGKVYWRRNYLSTKIAKNTANEYFSFNISRELGQIKRSNAVFKVEIFYNQELYAEKYFLFVPLRTLNIDSSDISKKYYKVDDGYAIELSTNHFAYGIFLLTNKTGILSDNYFELAPGDTKKIIFYTDNEIYGIEASFKAMSYADRNKKKLFNLKVK